MELNFSELIKQREIEEKNPPKQPKQKTVKVIKPVQEITIVDGKAIMRTVEKEVEEPVFDNLPVYDEAGNPVRKLIKAAVCDAEGKITEPAQYQTLMYRVPVME